MPDVRYGLKADISLAAFMDVRFVPKADMALGGILGRGVDAEAGSRGRTHSGDQTAAGDEKAPAGADNPTGAATAAGMNRLLLQR